MALGYGWLRSGALKLSVAAAVLGEFDSNELAHPAFFHRHSVQNIRLCDRALIVGDDYELALGNETLKNADKTVNIAFVQSRIHLIQNTERAGSHHVDGKEQRHRCH